MTKKIFALLFILMVLFSFVACGASKILHCDACGVEVKVKESSNMEEDWIIYCKDCNEELFGEDFLLGN